MSNTLTYLMDNRWTKDAEGEFISVKDSYAVPPISLSVDGKSTQVTTTGKNLLSDVPEEWVKRTFSGLSGTHVSFPISIDEGVSYYYVNTTGTGMSPGMYAGFCDTLEGEITVYDRITMTNYNSRTFTNTENHPYLIFFSAGMNTTATQLANQFKSYKIFLSVNSSDLYEIYSGGAASPRPDWPQEITSINGTLLKTCAKNFVPNDDPETPNSNYTFNSSKRVIWDSENEGFRLTDSGAGVAMAAHALRSPACSFVAPQDGVYTFGIDTKNYTSGTYGCRVTVNGTVLNGYGWGHSNSESEWTRHSITRTLSKGDRFGATIYVTCLWRNISVVEGSEDIYEPYSSNVTQLLPDGYSLRSLPNGTKDELHLTYLRPSDRPGWAWYDRKLVKRVAEFIADGVNEGWKRNHESVYYRTSPSCKVDVSGAMEFMSPQFAPATTRSLAQARNAPANSVLGRTGEKDMVLRTGAAYETLADFTAWLSENPVTIYYPLETPVVTELDPIELPAMQSGLTNIWSDPSTNLSITYERDKSIVISNIKATIDDLATS